MLVQDRNASAFMVSIGLKAAINLVVGHIPGSQNTPRFGEYHEINGRITYFLGNV